MLEGDIDWGQEGGQRIKGHRNWLGICFFTSNGGTFLGGGRDVGTQVFQ